MGLESCLNIATETITDDWVNLATKLSYITQKQELEKLGTRVERQEVWEDICDINRLQRKASCKKFPIAEGLRDN